MAPWNARCFLSNSNFGRLFVTFWLWDFNRNNSPCALCIFECGIFLTRPYECECECDSALWVWVWMWLRLAALRWWLLLQAWVRHGIGISKWSHSISRVSWAGCLVGDGRCWRPCLLSPGSCAKCPLVTKGHDHGQHHPEQRTRVELEGLERQNGFHGPRVPLDASRCKRLEHWLHFDMLTICSPTSTTCSFAHTCS